MPRIDPVPGMEGSPGIHAHAAETHEAWRYYIAVWQEFTTLDPLVVDLCRLKSAFINDCHW